MKLWLKQTLLALAIVLVTVSACLYFFTAVQTKSLLDQAEEDGWRSLDAFCKHLGTLDTTEGTTQGTNVTTKMALIQYTFSTYAHLLQSATSAYSLSGADGYLYNIAPSDPLSLLPMTENDLSACRTTLMDGTPLLVQGKSIRLLDTSTTVYLTQTLTETYTNIASLTQLAQIALITCLVLCSALLPPVFRNSLRPLRKLTGITHKIADGEYALRADITSGDEVGELSAPFDRMAETVEQKIQSLEETAKRRELLFSAAAICAHYPKSLVIPT